MTAPTESISSTGRIGPKTSSCMIGESGETSVSTVGAMYLSVGSVCPPTAIVPLAR